MANAFPLAIAMLFLGIGLGVAVANFVTDHNVAFHAAKHRKELVELGVGYYDTRTGVFHTRVCNKTQP